jgi:hypothetical protein
MNVDIVSGIREGNIKSSLSKTKIRHMKVLNSDPLRRDSSYTLHIENTWNFQLLPLFALCCGKCFYPFPNMPMSVSLSFFVSSLIEQGSGFSNCGV